VGAEGVPIWRTLPKGSGGTIFIRTGRGRLSVYKRVEGYPVIDYTGKNGVREGGGWS